MQGRTPCSTSVWPPLWSACCSGRLNSCGARLERRMGEPLDFSAEIERFEMKPGRRRGVIHHIASAKSEETIAKRIVRLMEKLGMSES
ncbi:MAG: hypothetical protein CBC74_001695 [Crocinitomicaceae bacterium TMED114]|nr:MAG: hypothetical protein CBC74_001695 [Crocinitomicaceae bacterium TMED114]